MKQMAPKDEAWYKISLCMTVIINSPPKGLLKIHSAAKAKISPKWSPLLEPQSGNRYGG